MVVQMLLVKEAFGVFAQCLRYNPINPT